MLKRVRFNFQELSFYMSFLSFSKFDTKMHTVFLMNFKKQKNKNSKALLLFMWGLLPCYVCPFIQLSSTFGNLWLRLQTQSLIIYISNMLSLFKYRTIHLKDKNLIHDRRGAGLWFHLFIRNTCL